MTPTLVFQNKAPAENDRIEPGSTRGVQMGLKWLIYPIPKQF
jgi:hypothetical protein